MAGWQVFVRGLAGTVTREDLVEVFAPCGEITRIAIPGIQKVEDQLTGGARLTPAPLLPTPEPLTSTPKRSTRSPKPKTLNPKRLTPNPKPRTLRIGL